MIHYSGYWKGGPFVMDAARIKIKIITVRPAPYKHHKRHI